jgi:hypothetical protein
MNSFTDPVMDRFLAAQAEAGTAFSAESDIVDLIPMPPDRFLVHFRTNSLAGPSSTRLREVSEITVGVRFFPHHLRGEFDPGTVTVLNPMDLFHPNLRGPFVCLGHLTAGVTITDLLYQLYDVFRWENYALHDALNPEASAWARRQPPSRFPLDRRPLRRPRTSF